MQRESEPLRAGPHDRLLDATHECIARVGVAKTTVDDVARAAGCSRATVYRHFEGKDGLLRGLVTRSNAAFASEVVGAGRGAADLPEALTAAIVAAATWLQRDAALRFVVDHEPEILLPHLSFDAGRPVLSAAGAIAADAIADHVDGERSARLGEWVARITLSHLLSPSPHTDLSDPDSVRALVEEFLVPALAGDRAPLTAPALSEVPS